MYTLTAFILLAFTLCVKTYSYYFVQKTLKLWFIDTINIKIVVIRLYDKIYVDVKLIFYHNYKIILLKRYFIFIE